MQEVRAARALSEQRHLFLEPPPIVPHRGREGGEGVAVGGNGSDDERGWARA